MFQMPENSRDAMNVANTNHFHDYDQNIHPCTWEPINT